MSVLSNITRALGLSGRRSFFNSTLEGSLAGRRLIAWKATQENINALLMAGGETLRARARQTVRSNPYASNAADSFAANVVGAGIKPSCLIEDEAIKEYVQKLFLSWTDESDADGLTDFYGQQALIARALFEGGECFVRFRYRRIEDGLRIPLQLQILESEHLPFNKTEALSNGNALRCGIEFDKIGRRVAYHFLKRHPGDSTDQGNKAETVRVSASEVLHIYRPLRPGQIRGVPYVAPALVKLYLLDQYDDAELDRKKVAALFAGFITKNAPEESLLGETKADETGAAIAGLSPGTMQVLLPGEDIKFSSPADVGGSYEMFQYRTLLSIAAAMGIPYTNMTGDLKAANYSSLRAGTLEFRKRLEQFQHATLVFQLCRPVWKVFIDTAILAGELKSHPDLYSVKWITPKWDWVDPLKDRKAEQLAQQMGWKAPSDIIESEGYDVHETYRRIAADQQLRESLGIDLRDPTDIPPEEELDTEIQKPKQPLEDE